VFEDSLNVLTNSLSVIIPEPSFDETIEVYGEYGKLPQTEAALFKLKRSK
jgi:hypothetical protein